MAVPDLDGGGVVVKIMSSRAWRFPKTLSDLSQCRIARMKGSRDLLSRSPMHTDARDREGYNGGAIGREGKTLA